MLFCRGLAPWSNGKWLHVNLWTNGRGLPKMASIPWMKPKLPLSLGLPLGLSLGRSLGLPIGKGGGFSETNGRAPDAEPALARARRARRPLCPGKNAASFTAAGPGRRVANETAISKTGDGQRRLFNKAREHALGSER